IAAEINAAMFGETARRLDEAEKWLTHLKKSPASGTGEVPNLNQSLNYDDLKIQELLALSEEAGETLPEQLTLIEPEALQDFAENQTENLATITIDTRATYHFVVHEKWQQPLQKYLLATYQSCMEILSQMQVEINEIAQRRLLLKRQEVAADFDERLRHALDRIPDLREQLTLEQKRKNEALQDIVQQINSVLNTAAIADRSVRVLSKTYTASARKGLRRLVDQFRNKTGSLVYNYGNLLNTPKDLTRIQSESEYDAVGLPEDTHYQLKRFVESLTPKPEVLARLPFFYKQLFIGKAAPTADTLVGREAELRRAIEFWTSPNPDEHAFLVLGAPLAGKSFFADAAARHSKTETIVKIHPPVNGTESIADFNKILQKQLRPLTKGAPTLKNLPDGTVLIFEDLELWWTRSRPDGKVIKHIVNLVETHKNRLFFLLNCNEYAYRIMEGQGLFEWLNAPKIYLSPFDRDDLKRLLLSRHASSGLSLRFKGKNLEDHAPQHIQKLMDRFTRASNGLVGVALHHWLSRVVDYQGNSVEIAPPPPIAFPPVEDRELLVVLAQFVIHKHLDAGKLKMLFAYRERITAELIIRKLHTDGVILDTMGSTYELNPLVLPALLTRARELGLI
ncbi:MAG: hypothetical protein D6714_12355, partial [Bacteroidetes bacterium]